MRERPILFSGEMVRAILEGRKTQTRRIVKDSPIASGVGWNQWWSEKIQAHVCDSAYIKLHCPYGVPGDRLWVREAFGIRPDLGRHVEYRANHQEPAERPFAHIYDENTLWRPSIFMPRWASRITLEITDVRAQRVQEISREDAIAEGCQSCTPADEFIQRFGKIYGPGNHWVWAITFRIIQ